MSLPDDDVEAHVTSLARSTTCAGIPCIRAHSAAFELTLRDGTSLPVSGRGLTVPWASRDSLEEIGQLAPTFLHQGSHVAIQDREVWVEELLRKQLTVGSAEPAAFLVNTRSLEVGQNDGPGFDAVDEVLDDSCQQTRTVWCIRA